jgi:hypothetical protein
MWVGYRRQANWIREYPTADGGAVDPRMYLERRRGRWKVGTNVGRDRKGFIVKRNGKFYVRVSWTDPETGKRRELMRAANDRKHARQLQRELCQGLTEIREHPILKTDPINFTELAERYSSAKIIEAVYVGDRKVAGMRSLEGPKRIIGYLTATFGRAKISDITYNKVDEYRRKRLREGVTIATVNRESQ